MVPVCLSLPQISSFGSCEDICDDLGLEAEVEGLDDSLMSAINCEALGKMPYNVSSQLKLMNECLIYQCC